MLRWDSGGFGVRQIALAIALGVVLDAIAVRSLLVPAPVPTGDQP